MHLLHTATGAPLRGRGSDAACSPAATDTPERNGRARVKCSHITRGQKFGNGRRFTVSAPVPRCPREVFSPQRDPRFDERSAPAAASRNFENLSQLRRPAFPHPPSGFSPHPVGRSVPRISPSETTVIGKGEMRDLTPHLPLSRSPSPDTSAPAAPAERDRRAQPTRPAPPPAQPPAGRCGRRGARVRAHALRLHRGMTAFPRLRGRAGESCEPGEGPTAPAAGGPPSRSGPGRP
jgi:hypothetical protein